MAERPVLHLSTKEAERALWRLMVAVCMTGGIVVVQGTTISWEPAGPADLSSFLRSPNSDFREWESGKLERTVQN